MSDKKLFSSLLPINFLTGISDGLILPLMACIIAYPMLPTGSNQLIWIGVGVSLAGALVYGLARFRGEEEEIHHNHPAYSGAETEQEIILLKQIGIPAEIVEEIETEVQKEKKTWLKEIIANNMGWESPEKIRALKGAWHTGMGFLLGGLLVSLPFAAGMLMGNVFIPIMLSLFCLLLTGVLTAWITGKKLLPTVAYQVVRGVLAYGTALFLAYVLSAVFHK